MRRAARGRCGPGRRRRGGVPAGRPGGARASWTGVARPSEMTTARPGGGLCSGSNRTPNGSLSMSPRGRIRTARPWPRAMAARSTRCPKPGPNPAVRITLQPRLFRDAKALLASGESRSASSASAIAVRSKVPASALAWSPDQYWPECGSRPRREPGASRVHPRQRSQQRAFARAGAAEDRENAAGGQLNPLRPQFVAADPEDQSNRRDRDIRRAGHGAGPGSRRRNPLPWTGAAPGQHLVHGHRPGQRVHPEGPRRDGPTRGTRPARGRWFEQLGRVPGRQRRGNKGAEHGHAAGDRFQRRKPRPCKAAFVGRA